MARNRFLLLPGSEIVPDIRVLNEMTEADIREDQSFLKGDGWSVVIHKIRKLPGGTKRITGWFSLEERTNG